MTEPRTRTGRRASGFSPGRRLRGRRARAPGIALAMDPSVRPLATGAFYRARLPAATGRAGLEVGPHEHLAGGAPQWRGNVREDRTHPEEDKHRCERPRSCSEEYSHADPSLLHGRRTGDIEDRFRWVRSNDCAAAVRSGCNVGPARGSQRGTASPAPAAAQQLQRAEPAP